MITISRKTPLRGNMRNVARLWTEQQGYPTIFVDLRIVKEERKLHVMLKQERASIQVRSVPVQCEFHRGPEHSETYEFLLSDTFSFNLPESFDFNDDTHWLKFNPKYQGYYRVRYFANTLMAMLSRAMSSGKMPQAYRIQMLSDYYSFTKQTRLNGEFRGVLDKLCQGKEKEYGVILLLTKILTELHDNGCFSLPSNELVTKLLFNYHQQNGGISWKIGLNALNQYIRCQVMDYLANRLQDSRVISELQRFMMSTGRLL